MFIKTIDPKRTIKVPGNASETVAYAAKHFIDCAKTGIHKYGSFLVALSGGSTPKAIYEKLASDYKDALDWQKVLLFWSDERAVSEFDSESNYKMAMDAGFTKLPALPFKMQGEGDIQAHALQYEALLRKILGDRHFDLIMLGVGEDGHTASLFPNTKGLTVKDKWVVANEVPQKKTWRMTFTYPLINSAHNTVFYAMGESKQTILKEVFSTSTHPASLVSPSLWILDSAAAKFL